MSTHRPIIGTLAAAGALTGAVAAAVLVAPTAGYGSARPLAKPSSAEVAPAFNQPVGLAVDAGNVWVANRGADSVTEISPKGVLIRTLSKATNGLESPSAIVADGADVFVADRDDAITEVSASMGTFVREIKGRGNDLRDPSAMVVSKGDLWVTDAKGNSVTELEASTGHLVRVVANEKGSLSRFDDPVAITSAGTDLWVANFAGNSVTEIDATSGAVLKTLSKTQYGFSAPAGIAYDGTNLWVTDSGANQVTELKATTGAFVQILTNTSHNANYGFWSPASVMAAKGVVYVASPPGSSPMITQIDTSSGDSNWMMCNTNYLFHFANPSAFALDGNDLWVANEANNTLTEMNAKTGVLVTDVE
ncbi:MAG: NHL repeat-containing protein [Acidimicrobiales bacterium]